jgi:vacuolar-type H+-ATPase subunit E/Vma4
MALQDIIAKIEKDAENAAESVRADARLKAETTLKQARTTASEIEENGKKDAERAAFKARGRIVASATHDAKFAVQGFRASLITRVFEATQNLLLGLPKEQYTQLIKARAHSLSGQSGALTLPKEREEETQSALKESGLKSKDTKTAPKGELLGGFIFETETAVYDYSFKSLMKEAEERYSRDVAKTLFS